MNFWEFADKHWIFTASTIWLVIIVLEGLLVNICKVRIAKHLNRKRG